MSISFVILGCGSSMGVPRADVLVNVILKIKRIIDQDVLV